MHVTELAAPSQASGSAAATPGLFGELLRRPLAERAHLQPALLARGPPEAGAAASRPRGAYTCPLLNFRSYRQVATCAEPHLGQPTFSSAVREIEIFRVADLMHPTPATPSKLPPSAIP